MIYVAAWPNADGTYRRRRFATDWIDPDSVRMEAGRKFGVMPVEISNGMTGEVIYRDRRES